MDRPRITAEADIGGRDESVVMGNFQLQAHSVFPGSIESVRMAGASLRLDMLRPATLPGDANRELCHAQIRDLFLRVGLKNVIIDETSDTTEASHASPVPLATPLDPSVQIATHTTA